MPISLSVNVDLVDKSKFFEGKKGRYLDLILFETPESDYGDYLVKQRGEAKDKLPILGNAKYFEPKTKDSKDGGKSEGTKREDPW
jgi:hypothetical protein